MQNSGWEHLVQDATEGVSKLNAIGDTSTKLFYRGTALPPAFFQDLKRTDPWSDAAFLSTSTLYKTARNFATKGESCRQKVIMYLFGHSGANISEISANSDEQEVLFKPGTRFTTLVNNAAPIPPKFGNSGDEIGMP